MNIAELSIRRPIFITCLVILMLALGYISLQRMPVDQFPNVTFPIVMVQTPYPGAGPQEVETLVSKVFEEEMSTVPGIKTVRSTNNEGMSTVIAEFNLETDIKSAEQTIRDRVSSAKRKLPEDVKEPTVRRIDPADQPIAIVALKTNLPEGQAYDLADKEIKPKIEQISQVGLVEVVGGREREVQILLDRKKLKEFEVSASQVAARIASTGQNIPAGKVDLGVRELVFRTLGEYSSIAEIGKTVVSFLGNDVPVSVNDIGIVKDTLQDETSRVYVNGDRSLFFMIFRQSGANTISVVDAVKKRVEKLNSEFVAMNKPSSLVMVRDGSKVIRANVADVKESIMIGILLTVLVVYFFLGSGRSTFITGLALPNSLLGAFFLMSIAGFSINVMSLLALSLAVGLLIDDAIVVRENIFRHNELGKSPVDAAIIGTKEVLLAVVATTLTVIAVFGPIGFLKGVVGQFFKEFGLTVCFAMAISLFDAVTMAPMLSAYFAGTPDHNRKKNFLLRGFEKFQDGVERLYIQTLGFALKFPLLIIGGAIGLFIGSLVAAKYVPKTFLPPQDIGEFAVSLELPPGTTIAAMTELAHKVDATIRAKKEVDSSVMIVGGRSGAVNTAQFFINMVPRSKRTQNTSQFKEEIRQALKVYSQAKPIVKDIDMVNAGMRPFNLNIVGNDLGELEQVANQVFAKLKNHPALLDPDLSFKPGKPEFQIRPDQVRAERLGVASSTLGQELRTQVEGTVPAVFREKGEEYDIRVRLEESQRDLKKNFDEVLVPNVNNTLVRLKDFSSPTETIGPANITRQDRGRYIQIGADIAPNGPGMGGVMKDIDDMFKNEIQLPPGMRYVFVGQAENFKELIENMLMAAGLGILFIYLVLASLYESFVTPITIMLVLPLSAVGAFVGLLITGKSLDIFSMIGCIMLLGVATKNSILLVDYAHQQVLDGKDFTTALIEAGRVRLRPILMTTMALIAGMLPVAIGLNEASKQRTSMGVAIIGGLVSSTLLTLLVVPAAYSYFERFRRWSLGKAKKWTQSPAH